MIRSSVLRPPSKNFFWHSTEIGSCCFLFGFLIYADAVVLPVPSSSLRLLHSLPSRAPADCNEACYPTLKPPPTSRVNTNNSMKSINLSRFNLCLKLKIYFISVQTSCSGHQLHYLAKKMANRIASSPHTKIAKSRKMLFLTLL